MNTSLNEYFTERVLRWMSNSLNEYSTEWVLHWMSTSLNEYFTFPLRLWPCNMQHFGMKKKLEITCRSHSVKLYKWLQILLIYSLTYYLANFWACWVESIWNIHYKKTDNLTFDQLEGTITILNVFEAVQTERKKIIFHQNTHVKAKHSFFRETVCLFWYYKLQVYCDGERKDKINAWYIQ